MSHILFVALCCAITLGVPIVTHAQQLPSLFLFPTNGQDRVDPSAVIKIRAPGPIDLGSISFSYPDATRGIAVAPVPTVMLIEEHNGSLSAEEQVAHAVHGTYQLEDARTLTFHPRPLQPGTRYRCVVSGVFLDGGGFEPLPAEEIRFTTASEVPHIVSCSLEGVGYLQCDAPIVLRFSGNLKTDLPDVVRAVRLTATSENGEPYPIEHGVVLSDDGTTLSMFPTDRWPTGAAMQVDATMSILTGDALDNRMYTSVVRKAGRVTIHPTAVDGRPVPAALLDRYAGLEHVAVTDAVIDLSGMDMPEDRWRFVRWKSPLLNLDEGRHLRVTIPCELFREEIPIEAIIERIDTMSYTIQIDSGGVVDVVDHNGQLIKTVSDSDIVEITDDLPHAFLTARANVGYTFAAWQATGTTGNGSTSPSYPIGSPTNPHFAKSQNDPAKSPRMKPNFQTQRPTSERYRLRGFIQDVDAQTDYNAEEAVAFTTSREFEDAVAGQRTVCVQAERCWEIVGYITASTGERVEIAPVNTYCVTADLQDPENTVTFLVQRRKIQVRLEKVLLGSDDPNDVLAGKKPHSETYVRVELRTKDLKGNTEWKTLGDVSCVDNDLWFSNYDLRCGDEVRFRVRGSAVRGQSWSMWDPRVNYALPGKESETLDELTFTMIIDRDIARYDATTCDLDPTGAKQIRVRACFRQQFGVESISARVRITSSANRALSYFAERWLDPLTYREHMTDEPIGGRHIEYVPRHGTILKVRFTMPIDIRTIHSGGMVARSYDNTLVSEPLRNDLDFSVASSDNDHISFEPVDGKPITTVVFSVCDPETSPRMQALHGGSIDLRCNTTIKSLSGAPLLGSSSFVMQSMELPGYGLHLRDITYSFDGDNDFIWANDGETYHAMYGGDLGADQAYMTDMAFRRVPDCREQLNVAEGDCTLEHSDKAGPQYFSDMLLWMQPHWMDRKDIAWWNVNSYDEDCKDEDDCIVNNIVELLDIVREKAESYKETNRLYPLGWEVLIPDIISTGAQFLKALAPVDDQDEYLGTGSFIENVGTWWGVKRASYPYVDLKRSNTKYRLQTRLYVLRNVVR